LGEVGEMPTPEILRRQPRWTWFMHWGDPSALWAEREAVRELYESEETVTWEDLPWVKIAKPRIHYPIIK
jgi:mannan endo-1,4-beta-mannosidase